MTFSLTSDLHSHKKRIVIIGCGFAGAYCAQALESMIDHDTTEVLIVSNRNYLLYYPLLIEAGTGELEPRHIVVPVREFLRKTAFRQADLLNIDRENKNLRIRIVGQKEDVSISYDHLVLSMGSVTKLPPVPGLKEYGWLMKSISHALALRDRAIYLLECAEACEDEQLKRRMLHLVVVGGNYTGVETAGEFLEFMRYAARLYPNVDPRECRVTLVEIQDKILGTIDDELAEYALKKMEDRGMRVLLNNSVKEIFEDHCVMEKGEDLQTKTVIWCAGVAPSPLIKELDLATDKAGYIKAHRNMRVTKEKNIWAIGDCAMNPDPQGHPYPPTAQHATRQGKQLAENLVATLDGRRTKPCRIQSKGALAPLGCRTAVARIGSVKLSGLPAWFVWRSAYLYLMPGFSRKVRLAMDWMVNLIFRKTYVQLGLTRAVKSTAKKPDQ